MPPGLCCPGTLQYSQQANAPWWLTRPLRYVIPGPSAVPSAKNKFKMNSLSEAAFHIFSPIFCRADRWCTLCNAPLGRYPAKFRCISRHQIACSDRAELHQMTLREQCHSLRSSLDEILPAKNIIILCQLLAIVP